MPNRMAAAVLNDIGTEELAHLEMVSTIVHQLTRDLSMEEIEKSGFGPYYIDHTVGIWPQAAGGIPFNACEFQSKGDPITDLFENLAADGAYRKKQQSPGQSTNAFHPGSETILTILFSMCGYQQFSAQIPIIFRFSGVSVFYTAEILLSD